LRSIPGLHRGIGRDSEWLKQTTLLRVCTYIYIHDICIVLSLSLSIYIIYKCTSMPLACKA
jgi:hypothetical protein